jgi:hypothetical protein
MTVVQWPGLNWPKIRLHNSKRPNKNMIRGHICDLKSIVVDPWHFGTDPAPNPYPGISVSGWQDANKNYFLLQVFLLITLIVKINSFSYCFALLMERSGSVQIMTDILTNNDGSGSGSGRPKNTEPTDPDPQHCKKGWQMFSRSSFPSLFLGDP